MRKIELILANNNYFIREAFNTLRTNILFSGRDIKTIIITSCIAHEGKSTVSFELCRSLAEGGKRVLFVDADLRKSVLAGQLRIRSKVEGLSHYLSGLANISELLRETDIPGLYIMLAGARVPNSTELLGSENFARLVPALKEVFDYVIVDTAPVGQVIDCALMAPHLDGIAMVIDATHNSHKLERRIKKQLERSGGKVLGVVLNQVDTSFERGYYGRYYGGYNYYTEDSK
jgi:capsular exopolysaccharide synthesis family protein